jgi:hypothetical protein
LWLKTFDVQNEILADCHLSELTKRNSMKPSQRIQWRYFNIKWLWIVSFCLISTTVFNQPSPAYVLRGPHLLELMTQHYGRLNSLLVVQKVRYYTDNAEGIMVEADETLRYVFPNMFRSDTRSQNTRRIHVSAKGDVLTVIDKKIALKNETLFDLYKDILLYRSRRLLEKRLTSLGVDISITSLARFQGKIAYVLGAEKPDEYLPQIWIDKDSFQPIRWLTVLDHSEAPGNVLEIRYSEWRRVRGVWYPMHVDYYRDAVLIREIRVESLQVNPDFEENLFKIERLRADYMPAIREETDGSVSEELNEVEQTIDEFRKKFE